MVRVYPPPTNPLAFNRNITRLFPQASPKMEMGTVMSTYMGQEEFPKDFYPPPMMTKKYSPPPYIYKHIYVTEPAKKEPEMKKEKKKKKHNKDDSWDFMHYFESESEEDYEESSGSEEHSVKRKSKKSYKKKKKKILIKLLLAAAVLIAIKCIITKLCTYFPTFFPTTGRDEIEGDNDQLYHEGINIDRTGSSANAQAISEAFQAVFSPEYDETAIKYIPIKTIEHLKKS